MMPVNLLMTNKGNGSASYREAVKLIKEVTEGVDTEFIDYLVRRKITIWQMLPRSVHSWLRLAMNVRAPHFGRVTVEELYAAGLEARPDCVGILDSDSGREWLEASFLAKGE